MNGVRLTAKHICENLSFVSSATGEIEQLHAISRLPRDLDARFFQRLCKELPEALQVLVGVSVREANHLGWRKC